VLESSLAISFGVRALAVARLLAPVQFSDFRFSTDYNYLCTVASGSAVRSAREDCRVQGPCAYSLILYSVDR